MGDEVEKDGDLLALQSQLSQTSITWKQELERHDSQVETLQEKLLEVKASIRSSEDIAKKELEVLWRRVRTTATLLTYLKSKARIMAVPHLAHTSCGIKHQDGIGLIDKHGAPLCDWSKNIDLSSFENSNEETLLLNNNRLGLLDTNDGPYISEVLKSVQLVTDVMESLVKRVIMTETEAAIEKEKVNLGKEEIRKKALQIEIMSAKVREMEKFALGTNNILNEMKQKVEDMVQETSRQRMRAAENEQELCRVKQDFESLKSYVSSLIGVREALLPSDQLQSHENLLEMLIGRAMRWQSEKVQKETEVQELMAENVRLNALLDKKEAQLLALNEQCKFMALNKPGI
uniref:Kinesin-like protein KIF3C n=1 Tax=Anthurium amnicola TaxID=1678845 RepID=A0A1D1XY25_9ARAE